MRFEHDMFIRIDNEEKLTFKAEHAYFNKSVRVVKMPLGEVGNHIITRLGNIYSIFKIMSVENGANHYKVVEID